VQLVAEPPQVGREALEPGDQVLFYTDGLVEARGDDGHFFTAERLADFFERQAAAGLPAPETLRRLRHAVMAYQHGRLQDDATAVLVEWRRGSERTLTPQTV
jgi:serine phosphatase RsbU (regulator of sigma subunit)